MTSSAGCGNGSMLAMILMVKSHGNATHVVRVDNVLSQLVLKDDSETHTTLPQLIKFLISC